jgi:hypothetical protein
MNATTQTQTKNAQSKQSQFYRFQVMMGETTRDGRFEKSKSIGMAYLKEGQTTLTLRLWTLLNERFYVIPNKKDASRVLVLSREPNKNPNSKNKFFWNIVGNGKIDSQVGVARLEFDLFPTPIYMSIFPESSATGAQLPEPEVMFDEVI